MKILEITGGQTLSGTIRISGAKNSAVALIPAAILSDEDVTICNVPAITDTEAFHPQISQKKQTNTIMKFVKQLKQWKKLV